MQILTCKYDNLKSEHKELKILIKHVVKEETRQWGHLEHINMSHFGAGGGGVIHHCGIKHCCNFPSGLVQLTHQPLKLKSQVAIN